MARCQAGPAPLLSCPTTRRCSCPRSGSLRLKRSVAPRSKSFRLELITWRPLLVLMPSLHGAATRHNGTLSVKVESPIWQAASNRPAATCCCCASAARGPRRAPPGAQQLYEHVGVGARKLDVAGGDGHQVGVHAAGATCCAAGATGGPQQQLSGPVALRGIQPSAQAVAVQEQPQHAGQGSVWHPTASRSVTRNSAAVKHQHKPARQAGTPAAGEDVFLAGRLVYQLQPVQVPACQ
jgi:hypothetical protein